ncbi:hypothetical protein CR513_42342, partial [Mucuna pruriens]
MDKVFVKHIDHNLEVYMDDMIVKSTIPKEHSKIIEEICTQEYRGQLRQVRRHHQNEEFSKCEGGTKVEKTTCLTVLFPVEGSQEGPTFLPTPQQSDLYQLE